MNTALTIAGSDSSGGAGIQADLKSFSANGVYGMSVITAITAQNTKGVRAIQLVDLDVVEKQLDAIFEDISVDSIKIGMLGSPELVDIVADKLQNRKNIVLDPVLISKTGFKLVDNITKIAIIDKLFMIADVITPNAYEATELTGIKVTDKESMKKACIKLYKMGAKRIYLKSPKEMKEASDLYYDGNEFEIIDGVKYNTKSLHGTGCTLSSTISANLAKGKDILEAAKAAKFYIASAIEKAPKIGHGMGPVHHFHEFY